MDPSHELDAGCVASVFGRWTSAAFNGKEIYFDRTTDNSDILVIDRTTG
jgi:hypothetical protein